MRTPKEIQDEFIKAVAAYLVSEMATKSILLQMGKPDAKAWAAAYNASGCRGYATQEEAEQSIRQIIALTP